MYAFKKKALMGLALSVALVLGTCGSALAQGSGSRCAWIVWPCSTVRDDIPLSLGSLQFKIRLIFGDTGQKAFRVDKPVPGAPAPDPTGEEPRETPKEPSAEGVLSEEETEMLRLVNSERAKAGLRPLAANADLTKLARLKCQDMMNRGYFGHNSPTYGSPFDMIKGAGIAYRTAGENLAGAPTVASAHQSLMNSDGHRRNILNGSFTEVGIGAVSGGPYGMMFCQMFIGR